MNTTTPPTAGDNIGTEHAAQETTQRGQSIVFTSDYVAEVGETALAQWVHAIVARTPDIVAAPLHDDAEKIVRDVTSSTGLSFADIRYDRITEQIRTTDGVVGYALDNGTILHDPHHVTPTQHTPVDRAETDPENEDRPLYS